MLIMLTSRCHMGCKHCMQEATAATRRSARCASPGPAVAAGCTATSKRCTQRK